MSIPEHIKVLDRYTNFKNGVLSWRISPHPKVKIGSRAGDIRDGKLSIHVSMKLSDTEREQKLEIERLKRKNKLLLDIINNASQQQSK